MDVRAPKKGFLERAKSTGRTAPEMSAQPAAPASAPSQSAVEPEITRGPKFVQISTVQIDCIAPVIGPTAAIFRQLLVLSYKAGGKPFVLPNAAEFGFDRDQRHHALTKFKKCGAISIRNRPGKSPLITMLWEHKKRKQPVIL
jgi:hypothetical protein